MGAVPMPSGRTSGFFSVCVLVVVFLVVVFFLVLFVNAADQQLLRSGRSLRLLVAALLEDLLQLVVASALSVVDILVARLHAVERVVEHAHESVLVVLGLLRRI